MTIQELGALGEFVGSIAVLITLIYLSVQVRQNTRHARAQMGHDGWISNADSETARMGGAAAEALAKADLDAKSLTDKDLKILDAHFRSILYHLGRVEHLNSLGLEIYSVEQTANAYIDQFNSLVGKAWWQSNIKLIRTFSSQVSVRIEALFDDPEASSRSESLKSFRDLIRNQPE